MTPLPWPERIAAATTRLAGGPADAADSADSSDGAEGTVRIRPAGTGPASPWRGAFRGEPGSWTVDPDDADGLLVGVGSDPDAETCWRSGVLAGSQLAGAATATVQTGPLPPAGREAFLAGVVHGAGGSDRVDTAAAPDAAVLGDAVTLAATLTSAPANVLGPVEFADLAADLAARLGLGCTVLDQAALAEQGCGGLLAVGGGSARPPRLVDLRHTPPDPVARITLVGKGICFDSGGLSLKSPEAQQDMRSDKAGAAVVLAVVAAAARFGLPVEVRGLLALAENLPGPTAVRPGDVIHAPDGTEIQVVDTDFEGRLVMADALALAVRERPDLVVDVATLTYQVVVALGPEIAGVLSRDPELAAALVRTGERAGEAWWPLPLAERYRDQVTTARGVRNHPLTASGRAITAALFLAAFVPEQQPWLHADIAGPAWSGDTSGDNATGFGVRTLLQLLRERAGGDRA